MACIVFAAGLPSSGVSAGGFLKDDLDREPWEEGETKLPPPPDASRLIEFFGGQISPNHFFIDPETIDIGADGVVRYAQVVRTSGGATNVTFEGQRCETSEVRLYAIGAADGTWKPVRDSRWRPVNIGSTKNRHEMVLARDVFCPDQSIVRDKAEAIRNLKGSFKAKDSMP
ncbi:MAG: CNP1-like family protein [Rhodocyclaceae bacterium]|nr:CNP1-like family protein [Rhodocyclaceae bacterium]